MLVAYSPFGPFAQYDHGLQVCARLCAPRLLPTRMIAHGLIESCLWCGASWLLRMNAVPRSDSQAGWGSQLLTSLCHGHGMGVVMIND